MGDIMVTLPKLDLLTPVSVGAKEAVDYPNLFLSLLVIRADEGRAKATVATRNQNYVTKQIQPLSEAKPWQHEIPDLYAELDRVPVLAVAAGHILNAVGLLRKEKDLLDAIQALEEGADDSVLQSQLADVHAEMGITTEHQ